MRCLHCSSSAWMSPTATLRPSWRLSGLYVPSSQRKPSSLATLSPVSAIVRHCSYIARASRRVFDAPVMATTLPISLHRRNGGGAHLEWRRHCEGRHRTGLRVHHAQADRCRLPAAEVGVSSVHSQLGGYGCGMTCHLNGRRVVDQHSAVIECADASSSRTAAVLCLAMSPRYEVLACCCRWRRCV